MAPPALEPKHLTFAAEILGRKSSPLLAIPALLPLLDHDSDIVREGAVLGLSHHMTTDVVSRLQRTAERDASEAVRTVARDILENQ